MSGVTSARCFPYTLAPDIVEAILDGSQPEDAVLPRLLRPFAADWELQRAGAAPGQTWGKARVRTGTIAAGYRSRGNLMPHGSRHPVHLFAAIRRERGGARPAGRRVPGQTAGAPASSPV